MHDEQIRKLIEQFRAKFLELSSEEIQRLIEETRAEALAEARTLIKTQMLGPFWSNQLACRPVRQPHCHHLPPPHHLDKLSQHHAPLLKCPG